MQIARQRLIVGGTLSETEGTDWYGLIGTIAGCLAALVTFIGIYIAAANSEIGWVVGLVLGWFPAGIAAVIVFWLVRSLWIVAALGAVFLFHQYGNSAS